MNSNIMIPLSLFCEIVDFLEQLDISGFEPAYREEYGLIMWALDVKKQKLLLRDAYAKIIQENDPRESFEARMDYLREKRRLANMVADDPF